MRRGSKWGDLGRDWPEVNSADKCRTPPKSKRIQLVQPSINWVTCMTRINAHRPEPNAWPEYLYPRLNHRHDMGYTSCSGSVATITTYPLQTLHTQPFSKALARHEAHRARHVREGGAIEVRPNTHRQRSRERGAEERESALLEN